MRKFLHIEDLGRRAGDYGAWRAPSGPRGPAPQGPEFLSVRCGYSGPLPASDRQLGGLSAGTALVPFESRWAARSKLREMGRRLRSPCFWTTRPKLPHPPAAAARNLQPKQVARARGHKILRSERQPGKNLEQIRCQAAPPCSFSRQFRRETASWWPNLNAIITGRPSGSCAEIANPIPSRFAGPPAAAPGVRQHLRIMPRASFFRFRSRHPRVIALAAVTQVGAHPCF